MSPLESERHAEIVNQKRKRTNELIRMGRMVKETMATDGWKQVGFPLLQKMIQSSTGFYKDGEWHPGNADKQYAQALMDFNNRFYAYVKNIKIAQEQLKSMADMEQEQYTIPMLTEGSSYDGTV